MPIAAGHLDHRFSDPDTSPTTWAETERLLRDAELYWLTTVRADGRPHVTPLVGVWHERGFAFTTGEGEQKHRNLSAAPHVVVTTGTNTWAVGTDVVVEGRAERILGRERIRPLADAFRVKYGDAWDWYAEDDGFRFGPDGAEGHPRPWVYVVEPVKVLAFGKAPHSQTTFRR